MKPVQITKYVCSCGRSYGAEAEALECEKRHEAAKEAVAVGREVTYREAEYGGEQGQSGMVFQGYRYLTGRVVQAKGRRGLVEFQDGTRGWVDGDTLLDQAEDEKRWEQQREYNRKVASGEIPPPTSTSIVGTGFRA